MADGADVGALPGIAALPPTTARQIGSGQVLVDPSSVVKELIDNALDARAKSIFVDITANTIDTIQVKDDGHGISAEDRALVCRRYCTSKIRDFHDLKEVGGKWLGFRGEAMSSMAEMSGMILVTTRVEGEPVAVKLKYGRNGELTSTERDSCPVGTTVKVTNFFEHLPVRKQTATKNSTIWLAKIRRLMQAYAFARPATRLRLRILKAKNSKGDFVYAPKANANVEDTVLKVIGKDCGLQCDWTVIEADGFEIHAFLPKPTANASNIANHGAFVSVDARPMSSSRKTVKKVVAAFKDRLRKSNSSLGSVKNPFFCMNIICPPDSYDPNIEPAKDDVLFGNEDIVIGAVDKLLTAYYPVAVIETGDVEPPTYTQHMHEPESEEPLACDQIPTLVYEDAPTGSSEDLPQDQPRWRSSMYGLDEDDLEFLQEIQPPEIEQEDDLRAVAVSNPRTIARMNAFVKPKKSTINEQLLSPAKSQSEATPRPNSPTTATTPRQTPLSEPLTPQTSSPLNIPSASFDNELRRSIRHLPHPSHEGHFNRLSDDNQIMSRRKALSSLPPSDAEDSSYPAQTDFQRRSPGTNHFRTMAQDALSLVVASSAPRRSQRKQQGNSRKSLAPSTQALDDTWFGQPMRGSQPSQSSRSQRRVKPLTVPLFASDTPSHPESPVLAAAEHLAGDRMHTKNNTDIRDFLQRHGGPPTRVVDKTPQSSSFTPIKSRTQSTQFRSQPLLLGDQGECSFPRNSQRGTPLGGTSRATSAEPQPSSKRFRHDMLLHSNRGISTEAHDMAAQLRAYVERESPVHRKQPRIAPAHDWTDQPRRLRRRTTDGLGRTRSARLPLERVPHSHRIQDVLLSFTTSLVAIVQSARKLDMRRNSLEWGYPAGKVLDVFVKHITERKIMDWVIKLDEMLHKQYERMERVDSRCELHEGIQRGLDARKEQDRAMDMVEDVVEATDPGPADGVIDDNIPSEPVQRSAMIPPTQGNDDMSDFDMSPFDDLDADVPVATTGRIESKDSARATDDFEDDIDDDMLMDL
ncbi:Nn.00g055900.m01.CDS01 [Neocucurbitaria sp. VM-36]